MAFSTFRRKERVALLVTVDLILAIIATFFALWLHAVRNLRAFDLIYLGDFSNWIIYFSFLWLLSATLNRLYHPSNLFEFVRVFPTLLGTVALILLINLAIFFFSASLKILPRGIALYQATGSIILVGTWRYFYGTLARRPGFGRRIIIIGAGWAGKTILKAIQLYAWHDYQIEGFIDDDLFKREKSVQIELNVNTDAEDGYTNKNSDISVPVLGTSAELVQLVQKKRISEVILAVTHDISSSLYQAILDTKEQGVQITLMPVLFEQLSGRVPIEHIGGDNWYVSLPLDSPVSSGFYALANRIFDLVGALIGLSILLPFLPLIAMVIYLESPGPIFYTQERVGKGGKSFRLIKLRTMIPDAEPGGQAKRALVNDERITNVGRWLRKMRLDEMPQLINVLKGEMSAVGPRPERPEHLLKLDQEIPFHRLRNAVKPGMAGWAVVNYGYIESIEDAKIRLQYDLYYVKYKSLWLDIIILLRTLGQMLTLRGR